MMIFRCGSQARRQAVRAAAPSLNGIDYVEVGVGNAERTRRTLLVVLVNELTAVPPPPEQWVLGGGNRYRGLRVTGVDTTEDPRTLRLTCDRIGDLSWYTLQLIALTDPFPAPPAGYDPALAEVRFTFRPGCGADLDCRPGPPPGEPAAPPPPVDYTAKDYDALRRVALDHLARLQPGWQQAEAADLRTMLVEAIAAEADRLSYLHDAVDTEGLFGRARQRISMRRLARMVDYPMHDGCSARAFVRMAVDDDVDGPLPGTRLLTGVEDAEPVVRPHSQDETRERQRGALVFEVVESPPTLYAALSGPVRFHTWSGAGCTLPRGTLRATLAGALPMLGPGDLLLFSSTARDRDEPDAAQPGLRHVVRVSAAAAGTDPATGEPVTEVAWLPEDALPFDLKVSSLDDPGSFPSRGTTGTEVDIADLGAAAGGVAATAAVFGNLIVADHGETVRDVQDDVADLPLPDPHPGCDIVTTAGAGGSDEDCPALPRDGRPAAYRPMLPVTGLSQRAPHTPYDRTPAKGGGPRPVTSATTARAAQAWLPGDVRPALEVTGGDGPWRVCRDLLALDAADAGVVVEVDDDAVPHLRFGNNVNGRAPAHQAHLVARCTVGMGTVGNVDAGSINRLVHDPRTAALSDALLLVSNPLPAFGGLDPEPLERVRARAPFARLEQLRCVTEDDYAARAAQFRGVQRAFARIQWTGSWETVVVYVDRDDGLAVDRDFEAALIAYLETYRLMGHDLEIADPVSVPLELTLRVCPARGADWPTVRARLAELLSSRTTTDGRQGLFHPDRLTFGAPVDIGPIVAAAQAVPDVAWVEVSDLRALGLPDVVPVVDGRLVLTPPRIARLDNDPDFPDHGTVLIEQVTP
jgi:hypothetical protein